MTIPGRLNLGILIASLSGIALCLWLASHASWPVALLAALGFALLGNTCYALMHEAVHRHFHPTLWINETAGRILAGTFPTAFALQRVFHLTHHANNRSTAERFDYYAPHENRVIKVLQWYSILTGLYWLALPTFAVVYFLTADLIGWRHLLSRRGDWFARQTSAREFLDALGRVPVWRARADIAIACRRPACPDPCAGRHPARLASVLRSLRLRLVIAAIHRPCLLPPGCRRGRMEPEGQPSDPPGLSELPFPSGAPPRPLTALDRLAGRSSVR